MIDASVEFVQSTSSVWVISSFTAAPWSTRGKMVPLLNVNALSAIWSQNNERVTLDLLEID